MGSTHPTQSIFINLVNYGIELSWLWAIVGQSVSQCANKPDRKKEGNDHVITKLALSLKEALHMNEEYILSRDHGLRTINNNFILLITHACSLHGGYKIIYLH